MINYNLYAILNPIQFCMHRTFFQTMRRKLELYKTAKISCIGPINLIKYICVNWF